MPAISKIRLTNIVYEEGNKRYNDELFLFDGHNGAILLENGGGKTVLIQTALQAILPHSDLADRKIKNTLLLENAPAHIAVEWILSDRPRRYAVTAVSLFTTKHGLDSIRYVYEYEANDRNGIEGIPFVKEGNSGIRPSAKGEMQDYYSLMKEKEKFNAYTFDTIKEYKTFIEEQHHIISSEWESVLKINSSEGGVEAFFDDCKNTSQLFDRLLIPTVENSIAGHDANIFADMFEKQHSSLRHYKKLKETIEENKQIQFELEDYVKAFEGLHKSEQSYVKAKQNAKGVWIEISEQLDSLKTKKEDMSEIHEEWKKNNEWYSLKAESYEIRSEEERLSDLDKDYTSAASSHSEKKEQYHQALTDYYSYKFAELQQEKKEKEELLQHINSEIGKLDETEDLVEIEDEMEQKNRALLGFFHKQMEGLEKEKQGLIYERNPIINHIHDKSKEETRLDTDERKLQGERLKIQAYCESRLKDMYDLEQLLLANPAQEKVMEELPKWTSRYHFLDEEIILLNKKEKQLESDLKEATENKQEQQEWFSEVESEKKQLEYKIAELKKQEESVIKKLAIIRPQWGTLESIYFNEESINNRFSDQIEKLKKDRESLLFKERLAYRFVDDYSNLDTFFADAYLEGMLHSWKNQLDYIVTGVEYLQMLTIEERKMKESYPLWSISLITTKKSKDKLISKLDNIKDRIQYPILVLTTEEAVEIQENDDFQSWVAPVHWKTNSNPSTFIKWKEEIGASAKEMTDEREEKEKELKRWEQCYDSYKSFLQNYPYDMLMTWEGSLSDYKTKLSKISGDIGKLEIYLAETKRMISSNHDKKKQYQEEKQGLQMKMEKGTTYLQYSREVDKCLEKEKEIVESLAEITRKLKRVREELKSFNNEKVELDGRISRLEINVENLKDDDMYITVQSLIPLYTNESKTIILQKIRELEKKRDKIATTYGEWIERRKATSDAISKLANQMKVLKKEHDYIDEGRSLPTNSTPLLQSLWEKIEKLNADREKFSKTVEETLTKKENQKGKVDSLRDRFNETFPEKEVYLFSQPLNEVPILLEREKKELDERIQYINKQIERLDKEFEKLNQTMQELNRFSVAHHFNLPEVEAHLLNEEEKLAFSNSKMRYVQETTKILGDEKASVDMERRKVEEAKSEFADFCNRAITDVKMRNMALNGIKHKQTFEDIIVFKNNMVSSVQRATSYANEHIRQKDADLQAYINHIHSHLQTLTEELKQIPKKTKVKVEDDWKQIFTFFIPEWSEEEGKSKIRDYIEWILEQLESDRFLNDQGQQDHGKVRKDIEMWLQSKQLLQIVMNNEVMKVNCRKVTNDNKVSTRSFSWEQSNVWSGGEKWSKNMTLFLGILNYVAEKKQHIMPKIKRHRSVILDNPFGKASSDHVLSPVFFVAEQLGFQIIALTAHAEGKFLQDYFPIIYSCRLRASVNDSKKIMTKEKWLHHAYFQDHEPKTIDRLGEIEQLPLFE
ncbi:hypothetical protein [Evansella cellulosilytica]|uniref:Uncharacterized protein n=1 Tax=Evansella cellulosilytica (strain ATCC 21833 / DSM 2522 / FERM P-1141 / JCM 9156 / N-4) TaxID=649639 RepID=E6TQY2_EVAC2|nr:hypothetical protein [Evansella cellulosilytica]ADU29358.1 hypothetical protein Bcell_1088 [Evansella cellulosilytica DSM 2522]